MNKTQGLFLEMLNKEPCPRSAVGNSFDASFTAKGAHKMLSLSISAKVTYDDNCAKQKKKLRQPHNTNEE